MAKLQKKDNLTIYVFGSSIGESILLRLPDGKWGVVDCYSKSCSDLSKNPIAKFLCDRGVKKISFVCLTHPDYDHYMGLTQLLETFQVDEFWQPAVMSPDHLERLILQERLHTAVLEEKSRKAQTLARAFEIVREKKISRKYLILGMEVVPDEHNRKFTITAVGPAPGQIDSFQSQLSKCFDENGKYVQGLRPSDVNKSSAGLLVEYGKTKILLGGDIEKSGWAEALKERKELLRGIRYVKIAHHGSRNGYCRGLWKNHANSIRSNSKKISVLCPFSMHKLPDKMTINHVAKNGYLVFKAGDTTLPPLSQTADEALLYLNTPNQKNKTGCVSTIFHQDGKISHPTTHGCASKLR